MFPTPGGCELPGALVLYLTQYRPKPMRCKIKPAWVYITDIHLLRFAKECLDFDLMTTGSGDDVVQYTWVCKPYCVKTYSLSLQLLLLLLCPPPVHTFGYGMGIIPVFYLTMSTGYKRVSFQLRVTCRGRCLHFACWWHWEGWWTEPLLGHPYSVFHQWCRWCLCMPSQWLRNEVSDLLWMW